MAAGSIVTDVVPVYLNT